MSDVVSADLVQKAVAIIPEVSLESIPSPSRQFYPPCLGWTDEKLDAERPLIVPPMTHVGYQLLVFPERQAEFVAIATTFIITRNLSDLFHNATRLALAVIRDDHRERMRMIHRALDNDGDASVELMKMVDEIMNMILAIAFYGDVYDDYVGSPLFVVPLSRVKRKNIGRLWRRPVKLSLGFLDVFCQSMRYRLKAWPDQKRG